MPRRFAHDARRSVAASANRPSARRRSWMGMGFLAAPEPTDEGDAEVPGRGNGNDAHGALGARGRRSRRREVDDRGGREARAADDEPDGRDRRARLGLLAGRVGAGRAAHVHAALIRAAGLRVVPLRDREDTEHRAGGDADRGRSDRRVLEVTPVVARAGGRCGHDRGRRVRGRLTDRMRVGRVCRRAFIRGGKGRHGEAQRLALGDREVALPVVAVRCRGAQDVRAGLDRDRLTDEDLRGDVVVV